MKRFVFAPVCIVLFFLAAIICQGQNRFDGYSLVVDADSTANNGACPVRFLPQERQQNAVEVFLAGTNLQTPATGLTGCDLSRAQANKISASPENQKWCFQGPEELYEIKLSNGNSYLWPMVGRDTGLYNVKDFRPVRRVAGPTPKYTYSEPADYTKTIRNAMMIMASRQGGTLYFPDGDYIVGTTDGNTRDPGFEAITVPSGVSIVGASGNYSIPTTNLPSQKGAARIRLRNDKQTIFRIGGCTNAVTVRNIELLGNSALFSEAPRSTTGTYGIEGLGEWVINPVTKVHTYNQSQFFRFENVIFQNLDTGIFVHNANQANCDAARQQCNSWQFDNIRVDHSMFLNNKTGIVLDTFNSDWTIANSQFNFIAANAPGYGIHLKRGAAILIENTFGGGYDYNTLIGGTFLYIDSIGTVTMIGTSSERSQRSIYTAPYGATSSQMLTVIGSVFGDKIELTGRMNYVSTGNHYFGKTISAGPEVVINSIGDRFCYDPQILPGRCIEDQDALKPVYAPGFDKGRVMFRSGRLPEGQGNVRINRQPNFFGYDVEIGDGLLQHDPNITFRDITALAAPVETGSRVKDGAVVYCKDCKKNNSGLCTQGQAGTDGAFAKRINNQWRCD